MVHRALKIIYPAWFYETLHCTLPCLGVFRIHVCAVIIGASLSEPHINGIAVHELLYYEKLDHIPSSCIVIMVHNIMVTIVNIVCVQSTNRCWRLNRRDGVRERLSISIVTTFDASITGDDP